MASIQDVFTAYTTQVQAYAKLEPGTALKGSEKPVQDAFNLVLAKGAQVTEKATESYLTLIKGQLNTTVATVGTSEKEVTTHLQTKRTEFAGNTVLALNYWKSFVADSPEAKDYAARQKLLAKELKELTELKDKAEKLSKTIADAKAHLQTAMLIHKPQDDNRAFASMNDTKLGKSIGQYFKNSPVVITVQGVKAENQENLTEMLDVLLKLEQAESDMKSKAKMLSSMASSATTRSFEKTFDYTVLKFCSREAFLAMMDDLRGSAREVIIDHKELPDTVAITKNEQGVVVVEMKAKVFLSASRSEDPYATVDCTQKVEISQKIGGGIDVSSLYQFSNVQLQSRVTAANADYLLKVFPKVEAPKEEKKFSVEAL
jgi:hypothetical protein